MFMKHKHTPWGTDHVAGGMKRAAVSWAALVIGGFPTPTREHMYWLSCGEQELCISGSIQRESVVFPWAVWGQLRPTAEIHSTQNAPKAPCFLLHQPWQVVFVPIFVQSWPPAMKVVLSLFCGSPLCMGALQKAHYRTSTALECVLCAVLSAPFSRSGDPCSAVTSRTSFNGAVAWELSLTAYWAIWRHSYLFQHPQGSLCCLLCSVWTLVSSALSRCQALEPEEKADLGASSWPEWETWCSS